MTKTVLVIDDEEDIRALTRSTLQEAGYEVLEVGTGTEALQMVSQHMPDAVLLDIRLPDISGWDVLEQLKSTSGLESVRLVVFSEHDLDAMAEKARGLGADGFIAKPFDPQDLVFAIDSALGDEGPASEQGGDPARRDKLHEAIADHLEPGERVAVQADGLLKVASQFFTQCKVALTSQKLIVLKQAWPWGYKVSDTHDLANCTLFKHGERFDGSVLMVIRDQDKDICLYFGRRWHQQASAIRQALKSP